MDEFVARVRALMRRPPSLQSLTPEFGDIRIRPAEGMHELRIGNGDARAGELQIMVVLIRAEGTTVAPRSPRGGGLGTQRSRHSNALDVACTDSRES